MKTKIALKSRKFFKDSLAKSKKYGLDKEFKWSYTRARKGINFKNNKKQSVDSSIIDALSEWDIL